MSNYRTFGKTDLKVYPVGVGAWAIGGEWTFAGNPGGWGKVDDAESIRAIHAALDAGVNLIDTAANYGTGHSEEVVGRAIRGRRDQVIIATKFGFNVDEASKSVAYYANPTDAIHNVAFECERSLRHLGIETIDLYQFHWNEFDSKELMPELLGKLEGLVQQGKIRWYGWSTDNVAMAPLFAQGEHCVAIQHAANVLEHDNAMFAFTAERNFASLIRGPLAMGFLSDKYDPQSAFAATDIRKRIFPAASIEQIVAARTKIHEILTSKGRTLAQGALAWLLAKHETVFPIPGIRTVAQAVENAAAAQFGPLESAQMEEIEQVLGRVA